MEFRLSLKVTVDEQGWAREYGLDQGDAAKDAEAHLTSLAQDALGALSAVRHGLAAIEPVRAWSRAEVSQALNDGADVISDQLGGETEHDYGNLVVNAALTRLEDPDATFEDVVERNYDESPAQVREWWAW
ncbi:hypothetical protein [Streptomyces pseudovenezuelae]|uniref:hypothetical protein n=1 Tax=Streptomyces pseudovenezuelae TaxID=67350 RepID=UPI002E374F09|nr:hypothetical protein [Streptomyces pseudovenezuelae]